MTYRRLLSPLLCQRAYFLCQPSRTFSKVREGRFLNKIMRMDKPKKKYYLESIPNPSPQGISHMKPQQNTRRMSVLNKLFMKYITDLLASPSSGRALTGRGFTVTKVAVSPDFHSLNVYWIPQETKENENLDEILHDLSYSIRHELSQLNLMGQVPKIFFVRDKKYEKGFEILNVIEELRKKNDFENESQPDDLDTVPENTYETFHSPGNIFGLERQKILEKILVAKQKSLADHRSGKAT